MKREFLLSLTVGDTPLSKEVVDAIMEENGKDIQNAKAAAVSPFEDYDTLRQENQRLKNESLADGLTSAQWKEKSQQAAFDAMLSSAVTAAGGRNIKAISALLGLDTLRQCEDPQQAVKQALEALKQSDGYLFADPTPPPYAWGTGARDTIRESAPTDLAGALREKFERK